MAINRLNAARTTANPTPKPKIILLPSIHYHHTNQIYDVFHFESILIIPA